MVGSPGVVIPESAILPAPAGRTRLVPPDDPAGGPVQLDSGMVAFIVAIALFAGWGWVRRRRSSNVVRLHPTSPFPPYDWFAHESSPEEPYSQPENGNQSSLKP